VTLQVPRLVFLIYLPGVNCGWVSLQNWGKYTTVAEIRNGVVVRPLNPLLRIMSCPFYVFFPSLIPYLDSLPCLSFFLSLTLPFFLLFNFLIFS
jgi:hypothetical protein